MLQKVKRKAAEFALVAVDVFGILFAGTGAAVVAFFGKIMAAVVLAAISLGFFLRLVGRRRANIAPPVPTPTWVRAASAVIAAVLVGVIVEATDLPVRFHQPGFEVWHWALVLAALIVVYSYCVPPLRAVSRRKNDIEGESWQANQPQPNHSESSNALGITSNDYSEFCEFPLWSDGKVLDSGRTFGQPILTVSPPSSAPSG